MKKLKTRRKLKLKFINVKLRNKYIRVYNDFWRLIQNRIFYESFNFFFNEKKLLKYKYYGFFSKDHKFFRWDLKNLIIKGIFLKRNKIHQYSKFDIFKLIYHVGRCLNETKETQKYSTDKLRKETYDFYYKIINDMKKTNYRFISMKYIKNLYKIQITKKIFIYRYMKTFVSYAKNKYKAFVKLYRRYWLFYIMHEKILSFMLNKKYRKKKRLEKKNEKKTKRYIYKQLMFRFKLSVKIRKILSKKKKRFRFKRYKLFKLKTWYIYKMIDDLIISWNLQNLNKQIIFFKYLQIKKKKKKNNYRIIKELEVFKKINKNRLSKKKINQKKKKNKYFLYIYRYKILSINYKNDWNNKLGRRSLFFWDFSREMNYYKKYLFCSKRKMLKESFCTKKSFDLIFNEDNLPQNYLNFLNFQKYFFEKDYFCDNVVYESNYIYNKQGMNEKKIIKKLPVSFSLDFFVSDLGYLHYEISPFLKNLFLVNTNHFSISFYLNKDLRKFSQINFVENKEIYLWKFVRSWREKYRFKFFNNFIYDIKNIKLLKNLKKEYFSDMKNILRKSINNIIDRYYIIKVTYKKKIYIGGGGKKRIKPIVKFIIQRICYNLFNFIRLNISWHLKFLFLRSIFIKFVVWKKNK